MVLVSQSKNTSTSNYLLVPRELTGLICTFCSETQGLNPGPENTHLLCEGKYYRSAYLLFNWLGFDLTNKSVVNFNVSKATESKPFKLEVSRTVPPSPYKVSEEYPI